MAERRMFAKTIIDSDAFLDMPISARLLYYDLAMRADDDGFVNSPKKIMRMVGATPDDLSILAIRKFIIPFDNGIVVIKHWYIHNYIRKDTYNETPYKEQKELLEFDENKSYRLKNNMETERVLSVDEASTQVRLDKDSIDKVSIGKHIYGDSEAEKTPKEHIETLSEKRFNEFWVLYPKRIGKGAAKKSWDKINPNAELFDKIMTAVQNNLDHNPQWQKQNGQFIPHPATWLNQGRWDDDISTAKREDWFTRAVKGEVKL